MRATVDLTEGERLYYQRMLVNLYNKLHGIDINLLILGYRRSSYRAPCTFCGEVSDLFISLLGRMPTSEEIIMLVDSGFSRFGATCSTYGRCFYGNIQ